MRRSGVIDRYVKAACVPVRLMSGASPATRSWDFSLTVRPGFGVNVTGAAIPGGRINVRYAPDGPLITAADAGDYIYPYDVRVDGVRLYVKASGVTAAFSKPQTWLFDYDVDRRRLIARVKVDPVVLPHECPLSP